MNMKFTSLTFLIAAVAGMSFSQAAYAGNGMRFDYAPNEFALEHPTGRHGGRAAENMPRVMVAPIAAGVVPKMHGLDNDFVSKPVPTPRPVVAAAPIAQPSVSAKVQVPNAFTSLFNPVKSDPSLVAAAPGQLPAFGAPNAQKLPTAPKPSMPALARNTHTSIAWTQPHKRPVAALAAAPFTLPEVKHQGSGYTIGATIPMATSTGASTKTSVSGIVVHH
jgi:hypothetical protein